MGSHCNITIAADKTPKKQLWRAGKLKFVLRKDFVADEYNALSPHADVLRFKTMRTQTTVPFTVLLLLTIGLIDAASAQDKKISPSKTIDEAVHWLQHKSQQLIRASRHAMHDGTTAFPPQVGSHYDAFWLRDYAYMLEGCPQAFTDDEL